VFVTAVFVTAGFETAVFVTAGFESAPLSLGALRERVPPSE